MRAIQVRFVTKYKEYSCDNITWGWENITGDSEKIIVRKYLGKSIKDKDFIGEIYDGKVVNKIYL